MVKLIEEDLSYKIIGACFQTQKELGRFCRERQYSDKLEEILKKSNIEYKREFAITQLNPKSPEGNLADFLIAEKIILELKAKPYITKEDYFQTQRYLEAADLKLGIIINFRNYFIKPKRVINPKYDLVHS